MAEEVAVYYAPGDYASFIQRFVSFLIDIAAMLVCVSILWFAMMFVYIPAKSRADAHSKELKAYQKQLQAPAFGASVAMGIMYHVFLRRLRGGTVGYRVMGLRLIGPAGEVPSWTALLKRLVVAGAIMFGTMILTAFVGRALEGLLPKVSGGLMVCFPLFFVSSYLPVRKNLRRQATHDRWPGTWVVRKGAVPAGAARPVYTPKLIGTIMVTTVDVEPIVEETPLVARPASPSAASFQ